MNQASFHQQTPYPIQHTPTPNSFNPPIETHTSKIQQPIPLKTADLGHESSDCESTVSSLNNDIEDTISTDTASNGIGVLAGIAIGRIEFFFMPIEYYKTFVMNYYMNYINFYNFLQLQKGTFSSKNNF